LNSKPLSLPNPPQPIPTLQQTKLTPNLPTHPFPLIGKHPTKEVPPPLETTLTPPKTTTHPEPPPCSLYTPPLTPAPPPTFEPVNFRYLVGPESVSPSELLGPFVNPLGVFFSLPTSTGVLLTLLPSRQLLFPHQSSIHHRILLETSVKRKTPLLSVGASCPSETFFFLFFFWPCCTCPFFAHWGFDVPEKIF